MNIQLVHILQKTHKFLFAGASLAGLFLLLSGLGAAICAAADQPAAADLVIDNQPIDVSSKEYQDLFRELEEVHHFPRQQLKKLFTGMRIDRKVLQLMDRQAEAKPYYLYRPLYITPATIALGKQSLTMYRTIFDRIEKEYGVDREFIVAIWGIESRFGMNQGNFEIFQTLNTFFAAYPRRSEFFRTELINFLILCRDNDMEPKSVKGSYAGAFGQAQFMPSSFNEYGVDFDGDNKRDLINSMPDIFASIANYLKKFGWKLNAPVYADIGGSLKSEELTAAYNNGRKALVEWDVLARTQQIPIPLPPDQGQLNIIGLELSPQEGGGVRFVAGYPNFQAITAYNHSGKYAMAVTEMAEAIKH